MVRRSSEIICNPLQVSQGKENTGEKPEQVLENTRKRRHSAAEKGE
jgi:hypothetical protein